MIKIYQWQRKNIIVDKSEIQHYNDYKFRDEYVVFYL